MRLLRCIECQELGHIKHLSGIHGMHPQAVEIEIGESVVKKSDELTSILKIAGLK
jgi:hypothetical protein